MPLQLNPDEACVELSKRIIWNHLDPNEDKEAQEKIKKYQEQGFMVHDILENKEVKEFVLVPPEMHPETAIMRILDDNGDSRILWNRNNVDEVQEAKDKFEEYKKKGYKAYVCRRDGSKGSKVDTFDVLMEELIMADQHQSEKPSDSISRRNSEAVLVPPTHPG